MTPLSHVEVIRYLSKEIDCGPVMSVDIPAPWSIWVRKSYPPVNKHIYGKTTLIVDFPNKKGVIFH